MSQPVAVVVTLLGYALILALLRDTFHELFHPSGTGSASGTLAHLTWRLFRRLAARRPGALALAGPFALIAIIFGWFAFLAVGWALVYWPYLPDEFLLAPGLDPQEQSGFVDAFYLSLVTLTTLGYGNIAPTADWLRVVTPVETLLGFGLLTAGVTWVLSIYPALTRRRSLAPQIVVIHDAELESGTSVAELDAGTAEQVYRSLTSQLLAVRSDLLQFSITYYFQSTDERSSLPATLPYLAQLAERGGGEDCPPETRVGSAGLKQALNDTAAMLGAQFLDLPKAPAEEVFEAYARDHLRKPLEGGTE